MPYLEACCWGSYLTPTYDTLYPIEKKHDYEVAVSVLNRLLDLGGADENHSLARLVTCLGVFIENYEQHLPSH